jgi:hypothetical protein
MTLEEFQLAVPEGWGWLVRDSGSGNRFDDGAFAHIMNPEFRPIVSLRTGQTTSTGESFKGWGASPSEAMERAVAQMRQHRGFV